jgi:hypothetical protein
MKVNTNVKILDFQGKVIKDESGKEAVAKDIISTVLNLEDNEHRLTGEKKTQAFQIGIKLWDKDEIDITVEQASFIKERVSIFCPPIVFGRISELLEGK